MSSSMTRVRARARPRARVCLELLDAARAAEASRHVDHQKVARELGGEPRHLVERLLAHVPLRLVQKVELTPARLRRAWLGLGVGLSVLVRARAGARARLRARAGLRDKIGLRVGFRRARGA